MVRKLKLYVFLVGCVASSACSSSKDYIKITGDTNYERKVDSSLLTSIYVDYRYDLYESNKKNWGVFLEGKITPSYDHFGNEIRVDGITTLGISF